MNRSIGGDEELPLAETRLEVAGEVASALLELLCGKRPGDSGGERETHGAARR